MNPITWIIYSPEISYPLILGGAALAGFMLGLLFSHGRREYHFRRKLDAEIRERLASLAVELASERGAKEAAIDTIGSLKAQIRAAAALQGQVISVLTAAGPPAGKEEPTESGVSGEPGRPPGSSIRLVELRPRTGSR